MCLRSRFLSLVLIIAIALMPLLTPISAVAQNSRPVSGVIAASSGNVTISFTDNSGQEIGRTVDIGDPIYLNDEIKTGPNTSLQILLRDQTVFSLGPNGSIIFDEFIYDPNVETDPSLSATVTKGAFKFISGKVAATKPEAMRVNLPNAIASIRGTAVAGRVKDDGESDIVLLTGAISVIPLSGEAPADIFQSGWGTTISSTGVVAEPFIVSKDVLDDILSTVEVDITKPQDDIEKSDDGKDGGKDGGKDEDQKTAENEAEEETENEVEAKEDTESKEGEDAETKTEEALKPEDIETIDELVDLVVTNVERDSDGNIKAESLTQYLADSGLADILGLSIDDLKNDDISTLNFEEELIKYLAAGGQPLWLMVGRDGKTEFINAPPAAWLNENPESLRHQQYNLHKDAYEGIVSSAYQGVVTFGRTSVSLSTGTLINIVPQGYNDQGYATFTNPNPASGLLDYEVVLDYDNSDISGTIGLRDVVSGGVKFDDHTAEIKVDDFTSGSLEIDPLLVGVDLASEAGIKSDTTDSASFLFQGSFGSITDGTNILDGQLGGFTLEYFNDDSPVYAEIDAAPNTRTFLDEAGQTINFDSTWTDNGDDTFSGTYVTYDLSRVVVDSQNRAVDGTFSNGGALLLYEGTTYSLVQNPNGPDSYQDQNDPNNQLHIYQGVEIPALKVEQYEAGTPSTQ